MKKILLVVLLAGCLFQPAAAGGISFGVGVAGGIDRPIAQDDQGSGTVFGFRGRLKAIPAIALEPNIFFTKYGQPTYEDFDLGLDGSKITSYGVDATLGAGFGALGVKPYGVFGAGFYNIKRDQTLQDITRLGWSTGFGIELGVNPALGLDIRGKLVVIPTEGGGSKKSASVVGGVNYYFGN